MPVSLASTRSGRSNEYETRSTRLRGVSSRRNSSSHVELPDRTRPLASSPSSDGSTQGLPRNTGTGLRSSHGSGAGHVRFSLHCLTAWKLKIER